MIAGDSCVFIDYLSGVRNVYTDRLDDAVLSRTLAVSPVVITELLSNPKPHPNLSVVLDSLVVLTVEKDYWNRAGLLRAKVRRLGLKANLGDALIAQSCIDHDVALLTTDVDFRHYVKAGGLKLAVK